MKNRFNSDVNTSKEAGNYYMNRIIQLLPFGWSWNGLMRDIPGGVEVTLVHEKQGMFKSALIFNELKNKGYMKSYFEFNRSDPKFRYVTIPSCKKMRSWLDYMEIEYTLFDADFHAEYLSIQKHYGDTKANRSGLYYMNHIDEGVYILRKHSNVKNFTPDELIDMEKAFCLHPLFQTNADFLACKPAARWSPRAIVWAMEYRHVANSYLPKDLGSKRIPEVIVSPHVKHMLIADKIQNYKDFQYYVKFKESKEKSNALEKYFNEWLGVLGVSTGDYEAMVRGIHARTGR